MRQLGINILYWADHWTDSQPPLFEKAKQAGYDAVEISLIQGGGIDVKPYRTALEHNDLNPFCIMSLSPETDISSPSASVRQNGIEYVKRALETTSKMGSQVLCGLPYITWQYFPDEIDIPAYQDRCATSLREIALTASDQGITICLEVINRFETFIFNTVPQALQFLQLVDHEAIKLHLDVYHMNMEEDNIADSIRMAGEQLGHLHCSANNRKIPGRGNINWTDIRQALDDIEYDGGLGLETFPLPDTETGRSTYTWRALVENRDTDARLAADFMRQHLID